MKRKTYYGYRSNLRDLIREKRIAQHGGTQRQRSQAAAAVDLFLCTFTMRDRRALTGGVSV